MNTRQLFLALVIPMIILQMTSKTWGQDLMGCGESKGCFKQPEECMGDDCMAYVTWETLADGQSQFSLRAKADGWVAVGLRPEGSTGSSGMSIAGYPQLIMLVPILLGGESQVGVKWLAKGHSIWPASDLIISHNGQVPADVYACTKNQEVQRSKNGPELNSFPNPLPQNAVTTISAESLNGVISCVFTRQSSVEGDYTFYNISGDNKYFILMAYGADVQADGNIQGNQHQNRWSTAQARGLQTDFSAPMSSGESLPKAHATLMVIAWIGFAY